MGSHPRDLKRKQLSVGEAFAASQGKSQAERLSQPAKTKGEQVQTRREKAADSTEREV